MKNDIDLVWCGKTFGFVTVSVVKLKIEEYEALIAEKKILDGRVRFLQLESENLKRQLSETKARLEWMIGDRDGYRITADRAEKERAKLSKKLEAAEKVVEAAKAWQKGYESSQKGYESSNEDYVMKIHQRASLCKAVTDYKSATGTHNGGRVELTDRAGAADAMVYGLASGGYVRGTPNGYKGYTIKNPWVGAVHELPEIKAESKPKDVVLNLSVKVTASIDVEIPKKEVGCIGYLRVNAGKVSFYDGKEDRKPDINWRPGWFTISLA